MTPTPEAIERAARLLATVLTSDANYEAEIKLVLDDHYAYLAERGAQVMEWRPIEEAPRDGTRFLAFIHYTTRSNAFPGAEAVAEQEWIVCQIDEETGDMLDWNGDDVGWRFDEVALGWMPLPAPPKEKR